MNTDIPPNIYAVPVNNFGVTSANCIATCALHKSADRFADVYPEESADVKDQSYIDDKRICDNCGLRNPSVADECVVCDQPLPEKIQQDYDKPVPDARYIAERIKGKF